ncbi:hypothetical protein OSB04_011580 [Centaurea solstitialis]|uniref:Retrotransposon gag domain-containing protein n=1 Tax=Centaurea solstitialis TaxID=347529 RepID=A0AA38TMU3_9ASTR|nr:hypothetical protein OSB04_011580 [Centaurea solstitialis]
MVFFQYTGDSILLEGFSFSRSRVDLSRAIQSLVEIVFFMILTSLTFQPGDAGRRDMEINKGLIKMIFSISFDGRPGGEPYKHLEAFEDICDLFNATEDEVKLRVFPFTLTNRAKDWFKRLTPGSIKTWEDLKSAFLQVTKARKLLDDLEAHYLDWFTDKEESKHAQLNGISSADEPQIKCTNCGNAPPTECHTWKSILAQSESGGGIIEQLFHHFSEQGKTSTNEEQQSLVQICFFATVLKFMLKSFIYTATKGSCSLMFHIQGNQ